MNGSLIELRLDRLSRFVWLATALVFGLGVLHVYLVAAQGWDPKGPLRALNLDAEAVLPAWYSSILLYSSGLALIVVGLAEGRAGGARTFWFGLAAVMIYMSLDESASLHEQSAHLADDFGLPFQTLAHPGFAWLFFGLAGVAAVAFVAIPMLHRIDRRTSARFVLAGAVYVFGALVMEFVGSRPYAASNGTSGHALIYVTVEEAFEFLGLTLFLTTVIDHLAAHHPRIELRLRTSPSAAGAPMPDHAAARPTPAE
ncbi:hypothetical protein [Rubellimicrobium roseum]|uniref:Uncharacterized protein n=1 Tax=Rubellimicrobium roseum TaxID=687525 RepID=A0A5C4N5E9_9RHOB|nr:hypothetical protein [Rubellimicrobium roseum]TNC61943.1 hypothetical protein FHG71_20710 [Rubellimicrobium roseum]